MKKIIVTTSWDDGDKLDLRLAELLKKYQMKGTFYVSREGEYRTLSERELNVLGQNQEIGAHTISHRTLTRLDFKETKKEILESKNYLEDLLGREIKMFCYPKGKFNEEIKKMVKEAGFLGARTTANLQTDDFFEFGTTLHLYPFSFWQTLRYFRWPRLAKSLFNQVLKKGGIYHLWGHSWEIEKYGLWHDLEEILKHISNRENVLYLTNSQVLENL